MISNVYASYMAEYGVRPYSKYSSHKKSELHDIYNNIIKLSKASPFYKVDTSREAQKTAIDIKESARSLAEISDALTDASDPDTTYSPVATSDNPELVDVEYVGSDKPSDYRPVLNVSVRQLATPQVNTGIFLNPDRSDIPEGTYSFDVDIASLTYELQFNVKDSDSNRDVEERIARLINKSNIGLDASVKTNDMGQTALVLSSRMTGVGNEPLIFRISDSGQSGNITSLLKLDMTSHYPSNAVFNINGSTSVSASNKFTVDGEFALTLKGTTEDDYPVNISIKANTDSIIDSLHELADNYNRLSVIAAKGASTRSRQLHDELGAIASNYEDTLNVLGISVDENGLMQIDDNKLSQASAENSLVDKLSQMDRFKSALKNKANAVMLNPMEYINKSVISYKNPARPTYDPYTTSIYSGMMYNGYC